MLKKYLTAIPSFLSILFFVAIAHAIDDASAPATIPLPQIPDHVFNITDYGAAPGQTHLSTDAIKKAIDACAIAGGGTVRIPAGQFATAPFTLTSNLNLHLDEGATLKITDNPADFHGALHCCIDAADCHDVAITGKGTIDAQEAVWWKKTQADNGAPAARPSMVSFRNCKRVQVQDVTLTNSSMYNLVPQDCEDVRIEGVHIHAPSNASNTDGIDLSGRKFLISDCVVDVGDDCIAVKAGPSGDPSRPSCENFLITHCTFLHGHGFSIGSQTTGGLRHMIVRDCTFDGTEAGIRMKANRDTGGLVEDVSYDNLTMKNVKVALLITSFYPKIPTHPDEDPIQQVTKTTPIWRNIRISNLTSEGGTTAGKIIGLPEMPISGLVLTNVSIAAKNGLEICNANGVTFDQSDITARTGPPIFVANSAVTGINPSTGR